MHYDITIIMPSYNKEKYIREAIESILLQETTYSYKIIVADDCSCDKTLDIVEEYKVKYPDKISILTSDRNQKLYRNVLRAYAETKTDYFCVLDPDDKWINPKHIQNALDFLEKHQDYTIYSTHFIKKYEDGKEELVKCSKNATTSTFKDGLSLSAKIASTQSVVYRNVIFKNGIPDKMLNLQNKTQEKSFRGDTFRNYLHLEKGKAYYEPTTNAIYNVTNEGIWTTLSEFEQYLLSANIFKDLWLFFDKQYIELLSISKNYYAKIDSNIFNYLVEKSSSIDVMDNVMNLQELNQYYNDFQKDLDKFYLSKSKMKIRIRYYLYKILHNYLSRKGVI